MHRLPQLAAVAPAADQACPSISVLLAARNEAQKLPEALKTLLAQDYPRYEVVAVDDRSSDATPQILDQFALADSRLHVVHVAELPAGWLGKTHALQRAYERSTGEWLVFTDADVHFAPDLLRRAARLAREKGWEHLTLFGSLDLKGFWEKTVTVYFGVGFVFGVEPWKVHDPRSRRYMGAGYFQLVRRSTYEAVGTHRRLALEVLDDMKLGKIVKLGGFASGVAGAATLVHLRWHESAGEIIRGATKNFFAASGYSVLRVVCDILGVLAISVIPFLALPLTHGSARAFAAVGAAGALAAHTWCALAYRIRWTYGLTHPLGALIFCYMMVRSMVVTLQRGGVEWRGTFYPLDELRKGIV